MGRSGSVSSNCISVCSVLGVRFGRLRQCCARNPSHCSVPSIGGRQERERRANKDTSRTATVSFALNETRAAAAAVEGEMEPTPVRVCFAIIVFCIIFFFSASKTLLAFRFRDKRVYCSVSERSEPASEAQATPHGTPCDVRPFDARAVWRYWQFRFTPFTIKKS